MSALPTAAIVAVVAVLAAITAMLIRSEPYTLPVRPKTSGRHQMAAISEPYRPRRWDDITSITPISAPPAEPKPVDELDPAWDWQAYEDELLEQNPVWKAAERELVDA